MNYSLLNTEYQAGLYYNENEDEIENYKISIDDAGKKYITVNGQKIEKDEADIVGPQIDNYLNMVPALMFVQEKYNINPLYLLAHFNR